MIGYFASLLLNRMGGRGNNWLLTLVTLGGVGPGVSPKTALSVGLKVDVDAVPAPVAACRAQKLLRGWIPTRNADRRARPASGHGRGFR
jgi:hypothetical protein